MQNTWQYGLLLQPSVLRRVYEKDAREQFGEWSHLIRRRRKVKQVMEAGLGMTRRQVQYLK